MSDLISRQAAIDAVKELCEHYTPTKSVKHPHMDFVIEELQHLPSAQPEIIRCKDCGKRKVCRTSTVWAVPPGDDWFCADGERREDV
jgi:hypothetical protein